MEILFVLIPLSLIMSLGGLAAFIFAVRKGQFDDLVAPPQSILFDEDMYVEQNDRNA